MLSLYFNTKITSASSNRNNGNYFYPVTYPNLKKNSDSIYILLETIKSYQKLNFEYAFFNIDLDVPFQIYKSEIEDVIRKSINASHISINFSRPSNLVEWKSSVDELIGFVGEKDPLLVVMNHDHLFIDYTSSPFLDAIRLIYGNKRFKKVFYYSHAPELLSWALNGKDRGRYKSLGNSLYESSKIDNWLDSFCVMTPQTLAHILSCAHPTDCYMGRIDWPGIKYRNLDLTGYISSREFFRHYDGYGHVSGMRLFSHSNELANIDPTKLDLSKQCDFYYQKWIDVSLLSIKDFLSANRSIPIKWIYIKSLDLLFNIFKITYLEKDRDLGILTENQFDFLVDSIYERIYFNANNLLIQIEVDNKLQPRIERRGFISFFPVGMKRWIKNLIGR